MIISGEEIVGALVCYDLDDWRRAFILDAAETTVWIRT